MKKTKRYELTADEYRAFEVSSSQKTAAVKLIQECAAMYAYAVVQEKANWIAIQKRLGLPENSGLAVDENDSSFVLEIAPGTSMSYSRIKHLELESGDVYEGPAVKRKKEK